MGRLTVSAALVALIIAGGAAVPAWASNPTVVKTITEPFAYGSSADGFVKGDTYGTIEIQQLSDGDLNFLIQFAPNVLFNANGDERNNHDAFAFNLVNPSGSDISGVTFSIAGPAGQFEVVNDKTNGLYDAGNFNEPPFAPHGEGYNYAIDYAGGAKQGHTPSSLEFLLSDPNQSLTIADVLIPGATFDKAGIPFTADVFAGNKTFNVGAIPEPSAWALLLMGVFGVGATLRRTARRQPATAVA